MTNLASNVQTPTNKNVKRIHKLKTNKMMKKMMMLSAMCLLTVIAKAQTITAESVMKVYNNAVQNQSREYAYNADFENGVLTAQYVYKKSYSGDGRHAVAVLQPYVMYRYEYDDKQRLASRVTLWWNDFKERWQNGYRLNYTYEQGRNIVECSRWNKSAHDFVSADEKIIYELQPDATVGLVSSYQRKNADAAYELTSQVVVPVTMFYGDELLTHLAR